MDERPGSKGFLIDGFPRNRDNLDGWTRQMSEKVRELFVLYINAPIEVCVQRCLRRGQGRSDDNEVGCWERGKGERDSIPHSPIQDSIRKRIVTYNAQTVPIIDHYSQLNMVREIDAGEKNADEVGRGGGAGPACPIHTVIHSILGLLTRGEDIQGVQLQ